jgi:hypothetical protein
MFLGVFLLGDYALGLLSENCHMGLGEVLTE